MDSNEIVEIRLHTNHRIELYGQITSQMQQHGFNIFDYSALDLGFELPAEWPQSESSEITLSQLIVIAKKLNMRIIISELFMEPRKEKTGEKE